MRHTRTVRLFVAALVVSTSFVGSAVAAQVQPGPEPSPVDGEGGYRFDVGGESPSMTFWVHLDMFTNLGGPGDFGFSAVGTAMDTRVIAVDVQLRFDGVGDVGDFLSNPFSRFSVRGEWELNLPFLSEGPAADEDFSYEGNETVSGRAA